jgi:hypothetical protein
MASFINSESCTPVSIILIGIVVIVYTKCLKHIMLSRCTDVDICCIHLKRSVISDDIAIDMTEVP